MFVYIIKSKSTLRYYIGCTYSLEKRLEQHNNGENKSTKNGLPWELITYKAVDSQEEAFQLEKLVKSYKGGNSFKKILNGDVAEWSKAPHC